MSSMKLGDRMKKYEHITRDHLLPNSPVIVRVDGRAFHTYTKSFDRPFDTRIINGMVNAAHEVAKQMQGFKVAYIQSDEASFLFTDYDTHTTEGWFDYNISKIVSISASIMTAYFNKNMADFGKIACFDARAFNVPKEEISNYFLWRAQDWKRNSVQMLARSRYSHKELHGKNNSQLLQMIEERGEPWDQLPQNLKNGTFLFKGIEGIYSVTSIYSQYDSINRFINDVFDNLKEEENEMSS